MAGYPQVVSPPPGAVRGYPTMQPRMQNYPVGYVPQPAYAPMGGYVNPGLQVRSPQGFATPPARHSPMPTGVVEQKGTLRPGQEIRVGKQVVIVDKYLSEGGYAHVYLTHSRQPIGPNRLTSHCLKRIAFRDDQGTDMLKETEKEIQVMKALTGNDRIVEYLDSEMKRLESRREGGPGWEVFILMEFCAGGGILDLLNKRLRDRLREDEILGIFVDVCEAVAHMHSLSQPLLHRDLKIENILCTPLSPSGSSSSSSISSFRYKVCDFGSTTYPATQPPRSKREAEALAYDLNRHTTLQYRSPEMVEPLLGLPVGLPADVWALGVLLYKLCYYTTPFEEHGPLAIVNAKYTFPPYPVYSPVLQHLIASMLVEQPTRRPSVFDILAKVHQLRGTEPSRDYTHLQTHSRPQQSTSPAPKPPANGNNLLDFRSSDDLLGSVDAPVNTQAQLVASIQPQRRGRPTKGVPSSVEQPATNIKPSSRTQIPSVRVQVTGENGDLQTSDHPPKNDLVRDIKRFAADFGDAFTPEPSGLGPPDAGQTAQSSFSDGFDGTRLALASPEPLVQARTTSPIPSLLAESKGFGDTFAPSSRPRERPTSSRTINLPVPKDATRPVPLSSQIASNGEDSTFEDRFPSVEQLAARADMDSAPAITKSPEHMSQPLRPSFGRQSSSQSNNRMMSFHQPSVTGGNNNDSHQARLLSFDENPPARSTQVTGTAFSQVSPMTSNTAKQASFDLLGSLTTDVNPPTGSNSETVGLDGTASFGTEESRPLFERLGSSRSNLDRPRDAQDSENASRDSSRLQPSKTPVDLLTGGNNASFDDYGYSALLPPNTVGKKNPPPVNTKPSRFGSGTPVASPTTMSGSRALPPGDLANSRPVQVEAARTAKPRPLPSKPDHLRQTGSSSPRPQSMYMPPSSFSPVSPDRAPASAGVRSQGAHPTRPAPISRRSSINEMVARYESLASPKLEQDEFDPSSLPRSRGQTVPKPAPKPVQLRAGMPAEQTEGASGLNRSRSMFLPSSSSRPGSRRESAERTVNSAGLQPEPARPVPSVRRISNQSVHSITEGKADASAGGQGKSVNALIARWNQGTTPAQGTHPSVSNRAPLGSGRRL